MSSSKFLVHQHRKKKHVYHERTSPFPVPIASITREKENENYWYHYMGEIVGNHVHVKHSGDISYLSNMGFFGRGLLCRGPPTLYNDLPYVHVPTSDDGDVDVIHVMRKQMYVRHMNWRRSLDHRGNECEHSPVCAPSTQLDGEFDSDVEYNVHANPNSVIPESTNERTATGELEKDSTNHRMAFDSWENNSAIQNSAIHLSANQGTATGESENDLANQRSAIDSWESNSANQRAAIDSWNTMEADEDFWHSDNISTECKGPVARHEKPQVISNNGVVSKMKDSNDENSSPPCKKVRIEQNCDISPSQICNKTAQENTYRKVEHSVKPGLQQQMSSHLSESLPCESTEHLSSVIAMEQDVGIDNCTSGGHVEVNEEMCDHSVVSHVTMSTNNETITVNTSPHTNHSCFVGIISDNQNAFRGKNDVNDVDNSKHGHLDSKGHPLPLHPYCCHDDNTDMGSTNLSDYIVIDDSDIDDNPEQVEIKQTSRWLPVRKKEVFQFNEPLVLSFEEAFFLCYGLGCLTVTDVGGAKLTIADMWCRFNNKLFLPKYVAYHYFRSKGWVPKQSALFGTDMLVYKVGPTFYHASYSVIIKTVYEGTMEEVPGYNNRKLTWSDFSGLNRVTEHVAKLLVFCYVIMPQDMSEDELSTPQCLSRFKVRLQQSNRWVSSQEREQGKNVDMD